MLNTRTMLAVAAFALTAATPGYAKLKVGDPAPPLKIMKWVKGTPVKALQKNKIYVVEFWATWCGPCRSTIPHLTELAKKHKGKITFIGVDIWESKKGAARMTEVTKFVKDMGAKMDYSVAMDDDGGTMAKTWMAAAEQNGIPSAFIIGKNGRIAWIGHPMTMDDVLTSILKGTFNAKAAAAQREKEEAEQEARRKMLEPVSKALDTGDYKTAVTELDKVFAAKPDMEKELAMYKFQFLGKVDEAGAFEYGKKLMDGMYKDSGRELNALARFALDETNGPKQKDYPTIIAMAERANTVTEGKDPNILDTLARAYSKSGNATQALAIQQKAVAALPATAPEALKKQYTDRVDEYQKAVSNG